MLKFDDEMTRNFFAEPRHRLEIDQLVTAMTVDNSLAVEVMGENAIQTIAVIAGPEDPQVAKKQAPRSWRAMYG